MARTPLMHLLQTVARRGSAEYHTARGPAPSGDFGRRGLLQAAGAAAWLAAVARPARAVSGLAGGASIAVVGAGLAGLTAAYELKKAGLSADVFEGNTRLGGRCYSNRGFFAEGQISEHGGEFIDTDHHAIRNLAAELGLTLDDVNAAIPAGAEPVYRFNGKPYSLEAATRDWQPLYPILQAQTAAIGSYSYKSSTPAGRKFDAMTITEWVKAYVPGGNEGQLGQLIDSAFTEENAIEASQQSALNVIPVIAVDPRHGFNLYYTSSDQRFHVHGGNDQIPTLIGGILGARVRTATPLVAIAQLADGRFRLTFSRDTGVYEAVYDRVILALPFAVMRVGVDYHRAGFRPLKRQAIRTLPMGASVKTQLQFNRRLWYELGCSGEIRLPATSFQTSWDVTRAQPGKLGIFNFWSGGRQAQVAGALDQATLAALVMEEASPILPGLAPLWNGLMTRDAWKQNPWSLGSYSTYRPGYQTEVVGIEREPEGHCYFAGEHTASQNGFLNAGVLTGIRAAHEVIASLQ